MRIIRYDADLAMSSQIKYIYLYLAINKISAHEFDPSHMQGYRAGGHISGMKFKTLCFPPDPATLLCRIVISSDATKTCEISE